LQIDASFSIKFLDLFFLYLI